MKKKNLYIIFLVLSVLGYLLFEWVRPKPVDWTESYSGTDKIPYGSYIMRDLLPELFPDQPIHYQSQPIFDVRPDTDVENVIFINNRFAPDKFETEKLLEEVQQGKNIFIAAKRFGGKLADTLKIETSFPSVNISSNLNQAKDSIQIELSQPEIQQNHKWYYPKEMSTHYFVAYDTLSSTVLGTTGDEYINYIKIERGKGAFYLHSIPYLFTNFFMRDYQKAEYAFRVLSYLPVAPTAWDEYYKVGRSTASSPLRYIVSHRYLRWAWITALAGLFLFIIFRAKRKERIIPEMNRPENTTLEFTRTIGRLYHQSGNHKDLAEKKIVYFLKHIRDELNLSTQTISDSFVDKVAHRSGIEPEIAQDVFHEINKVQDRDTISSSELWKLNKQIETFYRESIR